MAQYALVVGVGSFQNDLLTIPFVENDVNEFTELLLDKFELQYEKIYQFTNASATREGIISAIQTICQTAQQGDRVILYFSTHGKTLYNTTYLAAYNAKCINDDDIEGWIRVEELLGLLHNSKCNILAFLDSCHSTQFWFGKSANDTVSLPIVDGAKGEYMAVFAAAGESESAYSDAAFQHGCWTYYLIEALSGKAPRAFKNGSRRVTLFSLQPYLKEKVSARMSNEHNIKQTPHFWGVYPDDVVIVETHDTEEKAMKIKEIYFGEIDTDSERNNAPDDEFLTKNFYDLNEICNKLASNNGIQVIIGNKGSGKTYLGEFLATSNENVIYQSVGTISFSDIQNLTVAQVDTRGKFVQAWLFALYTTLACIIVKEEKPGWEEIGGLLKEIYGNNIEMILQTFTASKRILLNKRLKRGIKLSDTYNYFQEENGVTNLDGLVSTYTYLFNKYYKTEKLYFLLDGLDEQLRGKLTEDQQKFLLDLLEAVNQSHQGLNRVRIVLLFRNDLLHALPGEANLNKTITARSCTLSWLSTNPRYEDTPLYQFLEKRIDTSAENIGLATKIKLREILPAQMKGADTWEWILKLTTYTPRDVVSYFNCCKKFAGDQLCLTTENLWDALRPYSEYLWTELQDVLAGTLLSGRGDQLLCLFNKLVQRKNMRASTRFSFNDFNAAYKETAELSDMSVSDILKILYEAGMMCAHTNTGTYWNFRENPVSYDFDVWKGSVFEIHTGLWKKLHIW